MGSTIAQGIIHGFLLRETAAGRRARTSSPGTHLLTRLVNGEWTVFITDGMQLELVDGELTARIVSSNPAGRRESCSAG
jgi:hypothetical protein